MPKTILKILFSLILFAIFFIGLFYYNNKTVHSEGDIYKGKTQTISLFSLIKSREPVTILSFGDFMLGRVVAKVMEGTGISPFEKITQQKENLFKDTDFVVANLEGPITDTENCQTKAYSFKFKPEIATLLEESGFDLFNLANNHAFDCFQKGLDDTRKYLTQSGIDYFGVDNLDESFIIREINNKKIVFAGIDLTIPMVSLEEFYLKIKELKEENDFVIVNIHWGQEYELENSETQSLIGKKLIDNGADIIFGHHPHVIQPVEIYKNRPIFYSLGNFVFDQNMINTNIGFGVLTSLGKDKMEFEIHPFNIIKTRPEFMDTEKSLKFCQNFLENKVLSYMGCSFEVSF